MWIKLPWDADGTVSQWTPVLGERGIYISCVPCITVRVDHVWNVLSSLINDRDA